MCINILRGECGTWDQTTSASEEYMAYGYNRYAAFNHNILHVKMSSLDKMLKWKDPYFGAGLVKEDDIKSSAADLNRIIRADTSAVSNESSRDPTD